MSFGRNDDGIPDGQSGQGDPGGAGGAGGRGGGRFEFEDMPVYGVVILSVVCAIGIIGNLLIIGAVLFNKSLRKRNNAFVINLAVADLVVTAFIMPVNLASTRRELDLTAKSPGEDKLCDALSFLVVTTMIASTFSLTVVAIERYFHVCHNSLHRQMFKTPVIVVLVGVIWALAAVVGAQGYTGWAKFAYIKRMFACFYVPKGNTSFNLFLAFICFFIPVPTLVYCYGRIFWVVHQRATYMVSAAESKNPTHSLLQAMERRLLGTMLVIVWVFFVCWGLLACMLLAISLVDSLPDWLGPTALWLALCNSSMNSFIYGLMNSQFRAGYLITLQKIVCYQYWGRKPAVHAGDKEGVINGGWVTTTEVSFDGLPLKTISG